MTKVEVEVKAGVDVVDVKVDESEVKVVVEDEKEVVVLVLESILVGVSTRKSGRNDETDLSRLSWPSCTRCDRYPSVPVQSAVYQSTGTRRSLQSVCEGCGAGRIKMINAFSTSCQSKKTLWMVIVGLEC